METMLVHPAAVDSNSQSKHRPRVADQADWLSIACGKVDVLKEQDFSHALFLYLSGSEILRNQ
ncbi:MAG: hypothetical protein ABR991_01000 [Terracidiphilus sp.]|jgi:hypothetical protein